MTPKIFDINEFIQLQYDNEIWNLYIQGELANLEEFLDKNSNPKLVTAIKEIMKNEVNPVEDTEETQIVDQPIEAPNQTRSKTPILDLIDSYVGNDVLEIFGDTGSGKTAFVKQVANEAANAGKTVFYLDTERNLTKKDIELLKGCTYKYTPVIEEIDSIVQKLPQADVVILDSVGFPVLTTFARMSMKQKGDALLKLIAIFGSLKEWAYRNNGVVLVTNQPESEFNKGPNHILRPFGDKSQFAAKEIWETIKQDSKPGLTTSSIKAFRSRSVGRGTPISQMKITNAGVEVA
jgi:Cdc6-like AAA superfamily ATPase